MELGAGIENETLQNLIRDCLLELNRLKFNLTELERYHSSEDSGT